jgi:hypothetical protein
MRIIAAPGNLFVCKECVTPFRNILAEQDDIWRKRQPRIFLAGPCHGVHKVAMIASLIFRPSREVSIARGSG